MFLECRVRTGENEIQRRSSLGLLGEKLKLAHWGWGSWRRPRQKAGHHKSPTRPLEDEMGEGVEKSNKAKRSGQGRLGSYPPSHRISPLWLNRE